jgi:DnaK suppressor protein
MKMNKKHLEKFKIHFNECISKIDSDIKKEIEIDISGDEVDEASGDSIAKVMKQLSERNLRKKKSIESALLKIEDGTFGECEECGCQIGEKRLLAIPDAKHCINCAEDLEHIAKQFA